MVSIKLLATASGIALLTTVGALAADYGQAPPVISEESAIPEEVGTGWYLRGDIGFVQATKPTVKFGGSKLDNVSTGNTYNVGIGFGYKLGDWLRADATVDVINDYKTNWSRPTPGCYGATACTTAGTDSTSPLVIPILANAYVDFGNFAGFTPYVGGGVGVAYIKTSAFADPAGTYSFPAASRLSFAAAGAAGFSYDLGDGIQVDAGYRYLWVEKGTMGVGTVGGAASSTPLTLNNNGYHTVRIGLRYFMN